jgi:hypothetical protein
MVSLRVRREHDRTVKDEGTLEEGIPDKSGALRIGTRRRTRICEQREGTMRGRTGLETLETWLLDHRVMG